MALPFKEGELRSTLTPSRTASLLAGSPVLTFTPTTGQVALKLSPLTSVTRARQNGAGKKPPVTDCYRCGSADHLYKDCPAGEPDAPPAKASSKPQWCGACDPVTRQVDCGSYVARCPRCHPLGHQHLKQHRTCGGCSQTVYEWDKNPCGSHQELWGPVYSRR